MNVTLGANTGFLWRDRPFLERIARAGEAGFDAVEFHDEAQAHELDDVRSALREAGLPVLGLNARMGESVGCAAVPGEERRAREDIDAAIDIAAALDARAVHVLAGRTDDTEEAWATYRANLAHACERAGAVRSAGAPDGLTVLVEPLSAAAMPGYRLGSVARAASVIEWVGAPNLKIMFDVFHVHANGDPLVETYERYRDHVGHVQLAHPETRAEPATQGAHAARPMVAALRERGYGGAFGAEYAPAGTVEEGLGWMETLRRD